MGTKQYFYIGIAASLLLIAMAGCAADGNAVAEAAAPSTENNIQDTQVPDSSACRLPAEYRITYERNNGDGTISRITMAKDGEGNLYYRNGSVEQWFLAEGSGYTLAVPDDGGRLAEISSGLILKVSAVQQNTASFWDCVETADKASAPGFSLTDTASVAGRTCDLYTCSIGISGLNVTYQLYIDQQTGICLGWTEDRETGIFDAEESEGTFICTEFQTENIVLPGIESENS